MDYEIGELAYATYQVSYNFESIVDSLFTISFYVPLKDNRVEVISLGISIFKPGTFGWMQKQVKKFILKDILRVAARAELNGH